MTSNPAFTPPTLPAGYAAAITSLILWAMCFAGSLASEIRLATKRDLHALWSAPVVLLASAPILMAGWMLTLG